MDISKIPVGRAPPHDVNVIIEVPMGGEPVKYEMDKASGALFVDRFLHTAMFYPGNYGKVADRIANYIFWEFSCSYTKRIQGNFCNL